MNEYIRNYVPSVRIGDVD